CLALCEISGLSVMSESVKGNIFVTETVLPKNDWRSKVFQVALRGYFKEGLEFAVNWLIKNFQHLDHTAVDLHLKLTRLAFKLIVLQLGNAILCITKVYQR
ncbi:MAG: hypothetical protein WBA20_22000, partial [Ketobacter sp.]